MKVRSKLSDTSWKRVQMICPEIKIQIRNQKSRKKFSHGNDPTSNCFFPLTQLQGKTGDVLYVTRSLLCRSAPILALLSRGRAAAVKVLRIVTVCPLEEGSNFGASRVQSRSPTLRPTFVGHGHLNEISDSVVQASAPQPCLAQ